MPACSMPTSTGTSGLSSVSHRRASSRSRIEAGWQGLRELQRQVRALAREVSSGVGGQLPPAASP